MLQKYIKFFSKLRSDAVPGRWPEVTNKRAPYKPFLLLAILDLVAQHEIKTNFIELNAELLDIFDLYWFRVIGHARESNPVLPFFHLKSEGFWHLIPQPNKELLLQTSRQIRSLRDLNLLVLGSKLDEDLFALILSSNKRCLLEPVALPH